MLSRPESQISKKSVSTNQGSNLFSNRTTNIYPIQQVSDHILKYASRIATYLRWKLRSTKSLQTPSWISFSRCTKFHSVPWLADQCGRYFKKYDIYNILWIDVFEAAQTEFAALILFLPSGDAQNLYQVPCWDEHIIFHGIAKSFSPLDGKAG